MEIFIKCLNVFPDRFIPGILFVLEAEVLMLEFVHSHVIVFLDKVFMYVKFIDSLVVMLG